MTLAHLPAGPRRHMVPRRLPRLLSLACLLALAGCAADRAIGPHETLPAAQDQAAQLRLAAPPVAVAPDWWSAYHDAELERWIRLGLADSPSLREAAARAARAQALFDTARAAQAPTLGAGADVDNQRISDNGFYPPPLAGFVGNVWDAGLSGTIDFDLFGRLAARSEAARLGALAQDVDSAQARIRLAGAIAHAYFELAHAQQTQRILTELQQDREQTLDLVRRRVAAGFDTKVETRLAEVPVPQIRADIERANEQIALARHSLALLAGQGPQAADAVEARLPARTSLELPPALPLDLLARRADVAAARTRVASSLRSVDAARAEFYPNVNLTALIGFDAISLRHLFAIQSRTWQLEPAIHLPIFDDGLLRANLRAASADTDAAIDAYNATVLQAAGEVADALSSIASVRRQLELQQEATQSAVAAFDLSTVRYQAGLGNLLAVLSAQGSVLVQRRAEIDLAARLTALDVSLALSLGGGFEGKPGAEVAANENLAPKAP
jgi:NodT family efflux transporter outer membrane factor (OMF) lipoprotein